MNFNFEETAGVSAGSGSKVLKANEIHKVIFKGVTFTAKAKFKDGTEKDTLDIKFANAEGVEFTHKIFEPTEADFIDRTEPFKTPSNVKAMQLLIRHLIAAVNPILYKKIESGETKITAKSFRELCKFINESTKEFIGVETNIKLVANKAGYGSFPYFAAYNKEGGIYMRSRFIGENLAFTAKEIEAMKNIATATPTPKDDLDMMESTNKGSEDLDDIDMDF